METVFETDLVVTPRLAGVLVTELLVPTGALFRLALGAMIKLVIPAASVNQRRRQSERSTITPVR